jgi:hypothetical protein
VAPDSVRVFRGFRVGGLAQDTFFAKLGSIFIPGTVQIQTPVGLTAYMPSVMPGDHHPAAPDEIALVFYEYQDAYHEAKETVGGRAYSDLHKLVFDMDKSFSGFPKLFEGEVEPEMRYYLFTENVDWQRGSVNVFVGVRSGNGPREFNSAIAGWLSDVQRQGGGPDGAVAVASAEHVVYWEHWPDEPGSSPISRLAEMVEPVYHRAIPPHVLTKGVWDPYPGVTVTGGETFNFQFRRRKETS